MPSRSPHVRSLTGAEAQHESELGSIRRLTEDAFPILERISIKRMLLESEPARPPVVIGG